MPLLWMLTTALKDNAAVFAMPPQWIPKVFHWENFTIGLQQIEFWKRFGNTVFISVIVCFGQVCSCMSVGYALARLRFPGKKVWFYLIVGSMMIPGMVTVIPVFRLWRHAVLRNLVANDYPGFPRCTVPDLSWQNSLCPVCRSLMMKRREWTARADYRFC